MNALSFSLAVIYIFAERLPKNARNDYIVCTSEDNGSRRAREEKSLTMNMRT